MMDNLITKLEAASAGNRELSDDVLLVCGWTVSRPKNCGVRDQSGDCLGCGNKTSGKDCAVPRSCWDWTPQIRPAVTHSLEAALRLVPKDATWAVSCGDDYPNKFRATVMLSGPIQETAYAAIPALAVCIAVLRACQITKEEK